MKQDKRESADTLSRCEYRPDINPRHRGRSGRS